MYLHIYTLLIQAWPRNTSYSEAHHLAGDPEGPAGEDHRVIRAEEELNLWSMSVFMISMLRWCPSKLRRMLPSSFRSSTPSRSWWWRWHATSSWLMRSNTTHWRLMVIYISCASSHSSSLSRIMTKTFIYCFLCFRWYVWACLKCTPMIWSVPL